MPACARASCCFVAAAVLLRGVLPFPNAPSMVQGREELACLLASRVLSYLSQKKKSVQLNSKGYTSTSYYTAVSICHGSTAQNACHYATTRYKQVEGASYGRYVYAIYHTADAHCCTALLCSLSVIIAHYLLSGSNAKVIIIR